MSTECTAAAGFAERSHKFLVTSQLGMYRPPSCRMCVKLARLKRS